MPCEASVAVCSRHACGRVRSDASVCLRAILLFVVGPRGLPVGVPLGLLGHVGLQILRLRGLSRRRRMDLGCGSDRGRHLVARHGTNVVGVGFGVGLGVGFGLGIGFRLGLGFRLAHLASQLIGLHRLVDDRCIGLRCVLGRCSYLVGV